MDADQEGTRMSDKGKPRRMDISEFRNLGFLQEANRGFFHPHGLALEVEHDPETGGWKLGGIWDYRDDPEGIVYADTTNLEFAAKAEHVRGELERHRVAREELFGHVIQPLGNRLDGYDDDQDDARG